MLDIIVLVKSVAPEIAPLLTVRPVKLYVSEMDPVTVPIMVAAASDKTVSNVPVSTRAILMRGTVSLNVVSTNVPDIAPVRLDDVTVFVDSTGVKWPNAIPRGSKALNADSVESAGNSSISTITTLYQISLLTGQAAGSSIGASPDTE